MEGTVTKASMTSLIAAAALFGMGALSIASAYQGRIAFQPDAMVTQLYASDLGTNDGQGALLASNVAPPGLHAQH